VTALWVVIPAYNEESSIAATLAALTRQRDREFALVVVDNVSTDGTAGIVTAFAAGAPFAVSLITEPQPGAGAAADTGFRHGIAHGASYLLRTDADCLPDPGWVGAARTRLQGGAEMVCGRSRPRRDEQPNTLERFALPALIRLLGVYGRYRAAHRDPRYRAPYVLCHGHNIAITADLYRRCGGALRVPLHERSEDLALLNRAREHSDRIVRAEEMVVGNSMRRLRSWGARRTLLWYWDRRYRPADLQDVHVR
jgi:glycosyltransferase involved in cell wall biosynthesis